MLNDLCDDDVLDNEQMPSDEEDGDDNPELLSQMETRQEAIIEEFLEMAYSTKHERVEQLKASYRGNKDISKDDQKTQLKDLQDKMDTMRKQGVKLIKAKLATLMANEELTLSQKVAQLTDGETNE